MTGPLAPKKGVRTRFAPSPTGSLHLGNARTALLCWLLARGAGGHFVLRIEDTDAERLDPASLHGLQDDLRWLGLDWDEGPEKGGACGPYAQSARREIYDAHYAQLAEAGLSYPCFCSPERLTRMRRRQAAAGKAPRYDGACRDLSAAQVAEREAAGERPSLRFRVDTGRGVPSRVAFEDLVRGRQLFDAADVGDFIIRRSDGSPAFFFSNAVDDAMMEITHVLRGEDHLSNTPRQLMLLAALGLPAPRYGHASLIVGEDGAPLSKRHGSASVGDLRAAGFLPAAVVNHLARLGLTFESDELMTLEALAVCFDTSRLGRSPSRHDPTQLRHWQSEAVAALSPSGFAAWLLAALPSEARGRIPEARREDFASLLRDNVVTPMDAEPWTRLLFERPVCFGDEAGEVIRQTGEGFFRDAAAAVDQADTEGGFKAFSKRVQKATGARGKGLFLPLRAAFSGALQGPELYRLWDFLGVAGVRERLEAAAALARAHT